MKAVRIDSYGGPEVIKLVDMPDPSPELALARWRSG